MLFVLVQYVVRAQTKDTACSMACSHAAMRRTADMETMLKLHTNNANGMPITADNQTRTNNNRSSTVMHCITKESNEYITVQYCATRSYYSTATLAS